MISIVLATAEVDNFWSAKVLTAAMVPSEVITAVSKLVSTAGRSRRGKPTKVTNNIRALRFATGEMTPADLAHRIGVTHQPGRYATQRYGHEHAPRQTPPDSRTADNYVFSSCISGGAL